MQAGDGAFKQIEQIKATEMSSNSMDNSNKVMMGGYTELMMEQIRSSQESPCHLFGSEVCI